MTGKHESHVTHTRIRRKRIWAIVMTMALLCSIMQSSAFVPSAAADIFIGNHGTTTGLTLKQSVGYTVYSDVDCLSAMSAGQLALSEDRELYIAANAGYTINSITVTNQSDNTTSSVTASESGGVWHLSFPASTVDHQFIDVSYSLAGDTKVYTFDLTYGSVVLGSDYYTGFNGAGLLMRGVYDVANKFTVTQSGGATGNIISVPDGGTHDVTLNGVNISATHSISIPAAIAETDVILRLRNTNTIKQLFYYTGNYNSLSHTSPSSLTITSADGDGSTNGTLNTTGSGWSAAIGGEDNRDDTLNITIKGGTIVATGSGSAAIGGGGNGAATVSITGGHVTAINNGTGATIGGGGASTGNGGPATVNISGGTVIATNNGAGVAIGGGSTDAASGASATVNISGGTVSATSMGSGAVIGGGGTDTGSKGGSAAVNITGGTVIANGTRGISGGHKISDGTFAGVTVVIAGGSYTGSVEGNASEFSSNGITYKYTEVTFQNSSGNGVAGATVSAFGAESMGAGLVTDANGKIYLWVPESMIITSAVADGNDFFGTIEAGVGGIVVTTLAIEFYLNFGNVEISETSYSGYDSTGTRFEGTHNADHYYTVTQTDKDTANTNRISFIGNNLTAAVTLNGINTSVSSGIRIPASNGDIKHITLRLADTNKVAGVLYYTGDDSAASANASTLKITSAAGDGNTSGVLIVDTPAQWQAAIGGTDDNSAVTGLTIAGGTIIATGDSTSAIGGGGNGYTEIVITGGDITATNNGTGATIGGGGGSNRTGGVGTVTITGGTVNVTNNSLNDGNAIGGGGSIHSDGSSGTVNVSGGYIDITGGVGGGHTIHGAAGGTATIVVTGGTVTATGHVGSGSNKSGSYAAGSSINITGGSVNSQGGTTAVPVNSAGDQVSLTVVQFTANTEIYSIVFSDGTTYATNGMRTDNNGKLYPYLPAGANIVSINGSEITPSPTAIITGSLVAGSILTATLRNGAAATYQWLCMINGAWVSISTNSTYTTLITDEGKQIRAEITDTDGNRYESKYVVIGAPATIPSYVVTIPESVEMTSMGTFDIVGELYDFHLGNTLAITVVSMNAWKLTGTKGEGALGYSIYKDMGRTQAITTQNNTAVVFGTSGTRTLYYTVHDTATYAGTYNDRLTFTVSLIP